MVVVQVEGIRTAPVTMVRVGLLLHMQMHMQMHMHMHMQMHMHMHM